MIIVSIKYKAPISEIDKYVQAHREFLDYYYRQEKLIASGPMMPRVGGVIIACGNNKQDVEAIFKKDPYFLADLADYTFTEFTPVKHCDSLKDVILKTEGKLC